MKNANHPICNNDAVLLKIASNKSQHIKSNRRPKLQLTIEPPNIYYKLCRYYLDLIANSRDVQLVGTTDQRREQLYNLDLAYPTWLREAIQSVPSDNLYRKTKTVNLVIWGASKGIKYGPDLFGLSKKNLIQYTIISKLLLDKQIHMTHTVVPYRKINLEVLNEILRNKGVDREKILLLTGEERYQLLISDDPTLYDLKIVNLRQRYREINSVYHRYMIAQLYGVEATSENIAKIAMGKSHPLEHIILRVNENTLDQVIKVLGIMVPITAASKYHYVVDNIADYRDVVSRTKIMAVDIENLVSYDPQSAIKYLTKLKDTEIFNIFQIYVPYKSRTELVYNVANVIHARHFFVPLVRDTNRIVNATTVLGTSVEDVDTFMVAYGTLGRHLVYELDELSLAFTKDEVRGTFSFRRPDNINTSFTEVQIRSLLELLNSYHQTDEIISLVNKIQEGIEEMREHFEYDNEIERAIDSIDDDNKRRLREYLQHMFDAGMYMRRWRGPGYPYPLYEQHTHDNVDPDEKVQQTIGQMINSYNGMPDDVQQLLDDLHLLEYLEAGEIRPRNTRLHHIIGNVLNGEECIRMASTIFVGTAYHYLRVLFNVNIPAFDKYKLDLIV